MSAKRKIEVFSANCPACEETVQIVNAIACPSCDVQVLDMRQPDVAARAKEYGVRRVPAVAVNGKLLDCCANQGIDEDMLKASGVGVALS